MNDITPKEAIANLNHLYGMVAPDIQRSLDVAIKALERPSGDCISREALKDITYINKGNFNTVEGIREWIDNAPTVNTNAIADNEKSQGDLISREALRKEVTEKVNFTTVDGHIAYDKMLKLIDNAQAVGHSLLPLSGEADNSYMRGYEVGKAEGILKAETRPSEQIAWEQGYEAGLAQGKHNKPQVTVFAENADEKAVADLKAELENVIEARPKGEWKKLYGNHTYCSKCKKDCEQNHINFCGYCGADMR